MLISAVIREMGNNIYISKSKDTMKHFIRITFLAGLLVFITSLSALADGLPLKDGRYSGEVIIIELTPEQQATILQHYKPYGLLKLTKKQREYIANTTKMSAAPTSVMVVRPADTVGDCTCGLSNLGLIFKDNSIEIPLRYLLSDAEAERRKID
jgi:hypothetical protein